MIHLHLAVRLLGSLFFGSLAVVFLGLAGWMTYEAVAIWSRLQPTISAITAGELVRHPIWWILLACFLSAAFGALVTHFSHWTPVPQL